MANDPRTDLVGTVRQNADGRIAVKTTMGNDSGGGHHVWCVTDENLERRWLHRATIAAWGASGGHVTHGRFGAVLDLLRASGTWPMCVGLTQGGAPRHPLYVAAKVLPRPLPGGDRAPVQLPGQAALFSPEAS